MHVPILQTERLHLTVPDERDARELLRYALRTERYHAPWSPPKPARWNTLLYAYERAQQFQYECDGGHTLRLWFRPRTDPRGAFIGAATLSQIQLGARRACYLGYHLDEAHVGKGYMHEALTCIVDYAFRSLRLNRIEATYCPENLRSKNVLQRLGFTVEGYARKYLFINGEFRDHVLAALVNESLRDTPSLCEPKH